MKPIQATTKKTTFSRETTVSVNIAAAPSIVWALLTQSQDYPRWNSTVTSIQGQIKPGETIKLISYLDPKRTFNLKIKELVPENRLVWGDAQGERVYILEKSGNGVLFSMTEKIGGPLFPLFAGMIPSFDESFEKFAADIKKEAESIQQSSK